MSIATDVARAILAHHEELEASLDSRVDAVLAAAPVNLSSLRLPN